MNKSKDEKKVEKKTETTPAAPKSTSGVEVKRAFQINGKKFLVGDKAPKSVAEKKELKGFF